MFELYFVTDIHGSDLCFRKFLSVARAHNGPQALIMGGDITGKFVLPVLDIGKGRWRTEYHSTPLELTSSGELHNLDKTLADSGAYLWICDEENYSKFLTDLSYQNQIVQELRSARLRMWIEMAEEWLVGSDRTVYISAGNDDPWYIDDILRSATHLSFPDGRVVQLSESLHMLSLGISNLTPWHCPRDFPEVEIAERIESLMKGYTAENLIFNMHCPPFETFLDQAPALADDLTRQASPLGPEKSSVGSVAVRDAIMRYQPVLSLHGHVHESAAYQRLGRSLCINPGSEYSIGRLNAAIVRFTSSTLLSFDLLHDS